MGGKRVASDNCSCEALIRVKKLDATEANLLLDIADGNPDALQALATYCFVLEGGDAIKATKRARALTGRADLSVVLKSTTSDD